MALIKHSNAGSIARDALVLDFGDLVRQGEVVVLQARAKADQMLAAAREERERLIGDAVEVGRSQGHKEGFEAGRLEGMEQGRTEGVAEIRPKLEALEQAWMEALAWFNDRRELLVREAEREVVQLAAAIAERVVKRAVALDPSLITDQIRGVLGVVVRPTSLVLSVHPNDRALAERALPGLVKQFPAVRHAELVDDDQLAPGSCVGRTHAQHAGATPGAKTDAIGGGEIDASIVTQLDRIVEALLPSRDGQRP